MDSGAGAVWGLVVVNVATLATVIIRGAFAAATERRHRRYDLEDRAALAAKVVETAGILAAKVEASGEAVSRQLSDHDRWEHQERAKAAINHVVLTEAISKNTEISTNAFHEANGAKKLLAEEVQRRNDMQDQAHEMIDRVAAGTKERHDDPR